jgi:thiaminase (transcriptional activator TenA)
MSAPISSNYGSQVFGAWRADCAHAWHAYTHHAFVEGLRDGSLAHSAYLHYLIQDYVFLMHYSRTWALAVVKSQTRDEMRLSASIVNGLINHEIQLHIGVCAREGVCEDQLFAAEEELENLAYTRYVMDSGLAGDFLDMMAALSPCVFGYGEIGARLKLTGVKNNRYQEWIDTYADPEYQTLCEQAAKLIETAAADRIGTDSTLSPRWSSLCKRFSTATRLERGFWDMGLRARCNDAE